ncbi:MAG: hypothetical protein C0402_08990 [Thermodesulfovibrio sp.]|nr:hypothetical protein [Thermodesulfovibrio sp.]
MQKSLVRSIFPLILPVVLALVLSSCAATAQKQEVVEPARPASAMSQQEQDKKALEIFEQITEVFAESDRKSALPKAEALYLRIIREYPDAALGQESYWRLILICIRDYTPPQFEKAEAYHHEFVKKYAQSPLRREIEDSLAKSYYANGKWEKIITFYTPSIRRYIETGKLERPHDIFYYAEAKMNLGDLGEAEKGYKIILSLFPKSREGTMSTQRLEQLAKKKSSTK